MMDIKGVGSRVHRSHVLARRARSPSIPSGMPHEGDIPSDAGARARTTTIDPNPGAGNGPETRGRPQSLQRARQSTAAAPAPYETSFESPPSAGTFKPTKNGGTATTRP